MTLEDFFTLTEMKDGLSTLGRVEELVSLMQEQGECILNNVGDAIRQWSTVAGILAATVNKDCLNHFVQLDGLCFLNRWLQEALKSKEDDGDGTLEGLLTASLVTLDRLHIDKDKFSVSGIDVTVGHLFGHKNANIKQKAELLSSKWNHLVNGETCLSADFKPSDDTNTTEGVAEVGYSLEPSDTECQKSSITRCTDSSRLETAEDPKIPIGSSLVSNSSCGGNSSDNQQDAPVFNKVFDSAEGTKVEVNTKVSKSTESTDEASVDHTIHCNFASEGGESSNSKSKEPQVKSHGTHGSKETCRDEDLRVSRGEESVIPTDSSNAAGSHKLGLGLDCEIDALEMARQVAIEVEREVVDYREPCCSSPYVNPEGKQDQIVTEELVGNRSSTRKDLLDDAISPNEHHSEISENVATDAGEPEQTSESAKVISTANRCMFDLNEFFCDEEFDCSMNPVHNISANVSVSIPVASSKATPDVPVTTSLHFKGEMGWKGSAATSAFRPASPRRTSFGEKTSCSKLKSCILEIDLNVAEIEDDVAFDPLASLKQRLPSSGLPSGDSSVEVSSKTAERLNLDLNRLGDEDIPSNLSSYWRLHHHNGDQNLSSASSSSSRQQSVRDFDLNDNICLLDAGGSSNLDKSSSKVSTKYGISIHKEPDIRILGSRMAVERKDYINQSQPSFVSSGFNVEEMMAVRPAPHYVHMPPYGYAGNPMGTTMFIPPAMYGPGSVSYMMDPKGTTISAGPNGSTSVMPPYLMSVTGPTPSFIGAGPSRAGLDLNSGMTSMEVGSREGAGLKQLFLHNGSVEQTGTTASQPSGSGLPVKRKEPENGWGPYALGYKQAAWQ